MDVNVIYGSRHDVLEATTETLGCSLTLRLSMRRVTISFPSQSRRQCDTQRSMKRFSSESKGLYVLLRPQRRHLEKMRASSLGSIRQNRGDRDGLAGDNGERVIGVRINDGGLATGGETVD
jgi:hypothetical protein